MQIIQKYKNKVKINFIFIYMGFENIFFQRVGKKVVFLYDCSLNNYKSNYYIIQNHVLKLYDFCIFLYLLHIIN